MALIVADRVQETTTTSGTGTLTLNGAVPGFQDFVTSIGSGNTTYYIIYDPVSYEWEVGIGTFTSGGSNTLSRDTVLSNSLGTTAHINLAGNQSNVLVTYPAEKSVNLDVSGNVSPLGTITSGVWQGSTIDPAYGGTGVTSSTGADSVVLRDSNQNVNVNRINEAVSLVTASAGITALTAASTYWQTLVGTTTHTFALPDATTVSLGTSFVFDNDATSNLTVTDFAGSVLDVIAPGGYTTVFLEENTTVAGNWNRFGMIPAEVNWGTNSLNLGGSTVITNGIWQGNVIDPAYGGTGLTGFGAANYAIYSTSASTLVAGTLPIAAGGTGQVTANDAFNALAPSQTSNAGKYLYTDGVNTSWNTIASSQWTTSGTSIYYNTGNVGIGTNTPSAKLEVIGSTKQSEFFSCEASYQATYNPGQTIAIGTDAAISEHYLWGFGAYPIRIGTNDIERIRIFSSGSVSINEPIESGYQLLVKQNTPAGKAGLGLMSYAGEDIGVDFVDDVGDAMGSVAYAFSDQTLKFIADQNVVATVYGGTGLMALNPISTSGGSSGRLAINTTADPGAGGIYATGNITAYYSSDARLKENIKDVDNALQKVCAIGSKTFDWTDEYIVSKGGEDGYFVQKSDFGVVAQDVQEVFPQAVRTREDGTLAVDYEKLATLAFGAIKELVKRVEILEAK